MHFEKKVPYYNFDFMDDYDQNRLQGLQRLLGLESLVHAFILEVQVKYAICFKLEYPYNGCFPSIQGEKRKILLDYIKEAKRLRVYSSFKISN